MEHLTSSINPSREAGDVLMLLSDEHLGSPFYLICGSPSSDYLQLYNLVDGDLWSSSSTYGSYKNTDFKKVTATFSTYEDS